MSCLDHLLPFIDNGGRRLYIERRRDSKIALLSIMGADACILKGDVILK
jgi:hypothetical protein